MELKSTWDSLDLDFYVFCLCMGKLWLLVLSRWVGCGENSFLLFGGQIFEILEEWVDMCVCDIKHLGVELKKKTP